MKKLINKPEDIVSEMLSGLEKTNDKIKYIMENNVIVLKEIKKNQVAVISGGGSGHEPAHAGFVGEGMLSAAVSGPIFTSPTPKAILRAIESCKEAKAILLVVKNYTGDVLNFKIAKQQAEKKFNLKIEMIIVNDDVAVKNSTYTIGRRGIAGTILIHKIAGSAARKGLDIKEVKKIAEKVNLSMRTIGISTSSIIIPATKEKSFELSENEFEFGLGIHGEPGVYREKMKPVKNIVKEMIDLLLNDYDFKNKNIVLMLNGLGGSPQMELLIALNNAHEYLNANKVNVKHVKIGNFMTSMEMKGFSITLLELDEEIEELYMDKVNINSWN